MEIKDFIPMYVLKMEKKGLATRTFRRLDGDRQEAVINAILDEAIEVGPANVNIKKVAERANVSVGALYQYFETRDTMLAFALELSRQMMTDGMDFAEKEIRKLPLREALTWYVMGAAEYSGIYLRMAKLFARAAYQGEEEMAENFVSPLSQTFYKVLLHIIEKGVKNGELPEGTDPQAAARFFYGQSLLLVDSYFIPFLNTYFQVYPEGRTLEGTVNEQMAFIFRGLGLSEE